MKRLYFLSALIVLGAALGCNSASDDAATDTPPATEGATGSTTPDAGGATAQAVTFAQVAPILEARCVQCHGNTNPKEDLTLTNRDAVLKGGEHGAVVVPGNPEQSTILQFIRGQKTPRMPPVGDPLTEEQISTIEQWIRDGAKA